MANNKTEIAKQDKTEIINPWVSGISYKDFTNALNGKTPREYLKGNLGVDSEKEEELISWLENDLQHYYNNLKK